MREELSPELFVVAPEPVDIPSLTLALMAELSVGLGLGMIGFGVVDWVVSVVVDSVESEMPGFEELDTPSLTPALRPALRLALIPAVLVVMGTGTIGLGVVDSLVDSVWEDPDGLNSVLLVSAVLDFTGA